jgi:hypothetical protein
MPHGGMMHLIIALLGLVLGAAAIADAFETVVVARHAQRVPALTRSFYGWSWRPIASLARCVRSTHRRDRFLGFYGPLSLLLLLGLWAASLIVAFAMLQWAVDFGSNAVASSFVHDLYLSAASFFTVGSGEQRSLASRYLIVLEAGIGLSFLGLVIGYLPVLYQSFSNRELRILLLDARAGSPPSALEFIRRRGADPARLEARLAEWEEWALDLLQSHLSYPMLAFYRSQHANQSWLAALTAVADVSALTTLSAKDDLKRQAQFTFAAARHSLAHTASIFRVRPGTYHEDRLPEAAFLELRQRLSASPTPLQLERLDARELASLRAQYEPFAHALGAYFLLTLPRWFPSESLPDNWQLSSWNRDRAV